MQEFSPLQRMRYVGWLLRVNRLFSSDKTLRSGREFARVFRRDGEKALAPSHVTRWENGHLAAGHGVLRRYEQLLGIAPELLVSLNDAMVRLDGVDTSKYFEARESNDRTQDDLHRLLERACTPDAMTGAHWSYLTELVAVQPNLVLHPPSLWRDLADRLLGELSVAVFGEWWQRQEAMSRLLQHPHACRHAIAACIDLCDDPASPVVIEPMSLLEAANHPASNRYILDQIGNPNNHRALHGALLGVVRKVGNGHFHGQQWTLLMRHITGHLSDPGVDPTLLPLIASVGELLARRHPDAAALHRVIRQQRAQRAVSAPATQDTSRALSESVAALALGQTTEDNPGADDVLTCLVEDSLYHPDPERRLAASMYIGATPYREQVAYAMLQGFIRGLSRRHDTDSLTTLRTLTNLNVAIHRPLIHKILTRVGFSGPLRYAAATALPHCPGQDSLTTWRATLSAATSAWSRDPSGINEAILHAIAYGIGTDGHTQLLAEISSQPVLPASARNITTWLLRSHR